MNIKKVNKTKMVALSPFGRVPIRDARRPVSFVMGDEHVKNGKKNTPAACAASLAIRDHASLFPGTLLGAWVYKTYTLIATTLNRKVQAFRYTHTDTLRRAINGFDKSSQEALNAGDEVVLMAPKGRNKLGASNGRSNSGSIVPTKKRPYTSCQKRGVFVDKTTADAARFQDPSATVVK